MVVEREFGCMILKPLSPSPLLLGCGEFGLIRGAPWLPAATRSTHAGALATLFLRRLQMLRFDMAKKRVGCLVSAIPQTSPAYRGMLDVRS